MAEAKVLSGAGLRGQVAGQTALSTVGQSGAGLTYRGYDVRDLAADAQFEEVAYLLLYGELPIQAQLDAYTGKLRQLRDLPQALKEVFGAHPRRRPPDGRHAHRLLVPGQPGTRGRLFPSSTTRPTACWPRSRRSCATGIASATKASASSV
nr:hypothetical protein GCM10020185_59600 [Pseudomonas brassicacearum subsp. brassicacearum]